MKFSYQTSGTCSRSIEVEITDDGRMGDVKFLGGCSGNLQAVARLVKGRPIDEVVEILSGIRCGSKATSCGDQLAKALAGHQKSLD